MSRRLRTVHAALILLLLLAAPSAAGPGAAQVGRTGITPQDVPVADVYFSVTTLDDIEDPPSACRTRAQQQATPPVDEPCSLRMAIANAIALPDDGTVAAIIFELNPAPGDPRYDGATNAHTWTIQLSNSLPPLTRSNVIIRGDSQTDYTPAQKNGSGPEIFIDGSALTEGDGLRISNTATGVTIQGLGLVGFPAGSAAIRVDGDQNTIQGNYIGVNKFGTAPASNPNRGSGILLSETAEGNTVGGSSTREAEYNVISGNGQDGIQIQGDGNRIRGNFIGSDVFGSAAVANQRHGIFISAGAGSGADGNEIGTTASPGQTEGRTFGNVISGNTQFGIRILDSQNTLIYGNYVGVAFDGTSRLANTGGGIEVTSISRATGGTRIGGANSFARMIVAGNGGPGIRLSGQLVSDTVIANTSVGVNTAGNLPGGARTQTTGILVENGADGVTIGSSDPLLRTVIAGNNGDGIRIEGRVGTGINQPSENHVIAGALIGVVETDLPPPGSPDYVARPNAGDGIRLGAIASGGNVLTVRIGGPQDGEGNRIAENDGAGIRVEGTRIENLTIQANQVLANDLDGITLRRSDFLNAPPDRRGLTGVLVLGNTIAANGGDGLEASADSGSGFIEQLIVGQLSQANLVYDNGGDGIRMVNVRNASLEINAIGTDNGSNARGNAGAGLSLTSVFTTTIGPLDGARGSGNLIMDNGLDGIAISGGSVITMTGNLIGRPIRLASDPLSTANEDRGNGGDGISVTGGADTVALLRNDIFYNDASGVEITGTGTRRVQLSDNRFHRNAGPPVVLSPNPDPPTSSTNPNENQLPPQLTRLRYETSSPLGATLYGRYTINTGNPDAPGSCQQCRIEIYAPRPDGDWPQNDEPFQRISPLPGESPGSGLGNLTVGPTGYFTFTLPVNLPALPQQLFAIATDGAGNSSAVATRLATVGQVTISAQNPDPLRARPTQTVTSTHSVSLSGNVEIPFTSSYSSQRTDWAIQVQPESFTLVPGVTQPLSVTLTLPTGEKPSVRAGTVEKTEVRVTSVVSPDLSDLVTVTTVVSPVVILAFDRITDSGTATSPGAITYEHRVTNTGNQTETLVIASPGGKPVNAPFSSWPVTSTSSVEIPPGETRPITVSLTIPPGVSADPPNNVNVTTARYDGTFRALPGDPLYSVTLNDTTTLQPTPGARFSPTSDAGECIAGEPEFYTFTLENTGNSTMRFTLQGTSNRGWPVSFEDDDGDNDFISPNTVELNRVAGTSSFRFRVRIECAARAQRNDRDSTLITVRDKDGRVVGGASITIQTTVVGRPITPRVFMPVNKR